MPNEDRDPYHDQPRRFVGKRISFNGAPGTPVAGKRLVGVVEAQRYAGRTARGAIPDYLITVRGSSGGVLEVSLVESYATITDKP